jgi:signal transduction histidine kinase
MAAIIDDLLVAARSSFDTIVLDPRSIELAEETRKVADSISVRVSTPVEYDLTPVVAVADPARVRQIVRNLITNADRYGGEMIRVCSRAEQGEVIVEVRDSGPPIPAEMRRRIFEPYVSSGSEATQPAAIGLGLAISHTLAEVMGGSITYLHDGDWSIFELRLPRAGAHIALSG